MNGIKFLFKRRLLVFYLFIYLCDDIILPHIKIYLKRTRVFYIQFFEFRLKRGDVVLLLDKLPSLRAHFRGKLPYSFRRERLENIVKDRILYKLSVDKRNTAIHTPIVIVSFPVGFCGRSPFHKSATYRAVHLPGKASFDTGAAARFVVDFPGFELRVCAYPHCLIDNCGNAILNLIAIIHIVAAILSVGYHLGNRVDGKRASLYVPYAAACERGGNIRRAFSAVIALEHFQYNGGLLLVYDILLVNGIVAEGNRAAGGVTLFGAFVHSAPYLFRKLRGIILIDSRNDGLQNNAACVFGNVLRGGQQLNAVLLKLVAVYGILVAVPGEAVKLIHHDCIEGFVRRVSDHPQKIRPPLDIL